MNINKLITPLFVVSLIAPFSCKSASTPTVPTVPTAPTIVSFTGNPNIVILESSSTLSWNCTNAQKVEIDQGIGQVSASGTSNVTPNDTTTYNLTATNGTLTATKACTITLDWKNFVCYKTAAGAKYHRDGCQYLSQSKIQTTLGAACQEGLTACSVCKPPNCR